MSKYKYNSPLFNKITKLIADGKDWHEIANIIGDTTAKKLSKNYRYHCGKANIVMPMPNMLHKKFNNEEMRKIEAMCKMGFHFHKMRVEMSCGMERLCRALDELGYSDRYKTAQNLANRPLMKIDIQCDPASLLYKVPEDIKSLVLGKW